MNLYWQKLTFEENEIEKCFQSWRQSIFLSKVAFILGLNVVLVLIRAFLDVASFCDSSLPTNSFALCYEGPYTGTWIRNIRLELLLVFQVISLMIILLPFFKSRPIITQYFMSFVLIVSTLFWMYVYMLRVCL